jgi:hypothetical protein
MLFMLALSCMWFGMSASVRELISDRVIWQRENRVGVSVLSYVFSKVFVLGTMVGLQCVALSTFLWAALSMADYGFDPLVIGGVSALTGAVGLAVGLLTSAVWTSSEAAVGTLPLLLIPQITFSSIMVSVRDMGAAAKFVTWFTIQRYAFDAVIKSGEEVAVATYRKGEWEHQPINGSLWKLGLKFTDSADDIGFTLTQLCGILGGFAVVVLVVAIGVVHRRTQRAF